MRRSLWSALSAVSRVPDSGPVVSIVCLHQVMPEFDELRPWEPYAEEFRYLIAGLRKRFEFVALSQVPEFLASRRTGHAIVLTFDDGYENNFSIAGPILKRLRVPATFFVATGYLGRGCMWNDLVIESVRQLKDQAFSWAACDIESTRVASIEDRRKLIGELLGRLKYRNPLERDALVAELAGRTGLARQPELMMTEDEVVSLDQDDLFVVGAHTDRHPILASVSDSEAELEIESGKERLEKILGRRVPLFAYPNGRPGDDYRAVHVKLAERAGFEIAVTTSQGGVNSHSSPLQWPRQNIWRREPWRAALSLVRGSRDVGHIV